MPLNATPANQEPPACRVHYNLTIGSTGGPEVMEVMEVIEMMEMNRAAELVSLFTSITSIISITPITRPGR